MPELKCAQLVVLEDKGRGSWIGGIRAPDGEQVGTGDAGAGPRAAATARRHERDRACRDGEPPGKFAGVRGLPFALLALVLPVVVGAQQWNAPAALDLADRAIAHRAGAAADTSLHDYRARAHGFLFFLGAFGEGLVEPPRLIKADQLELEVYWKAPGASKQRIIGRRDRAELPTDIVYHQDHLGIIQNAFGRSIRLGNGDEVLNVPHPLSPGGPLRYDYATGDTITVMLPGQQVRVVELKFRPKEFSEPRIVGTAYVDVGTAELVRLAFNFTPAAYRDPELEDVSVVLDNALYEGRWWLPRHQEIEIRRRATLIDIPARGIIRGRWDVDQYAFNTGLPDSLFVGPEIVAAPQAVRDTFPWPTSLGAAIQDVAEPVRRNDLAAVRAEVARIAGRHALSGLGRGGLGARRVSDLLHANRVQGLVVGAGAVWRPHPGTFVGRVRGSYGVADRRADGAVTGRFSLGALAVEGSAYREVRDVGDWPIVAPLVNSISAQELGGDYGDYVRLTGGRLALSPAAKDGVTWELSLARERPTGLSVRAAPATGRFRANPDLAGPALDVVSFGVRRPSEGFAVRRDGYFDLTLEAGRQDGGRTYLRLTGAAHVLFPLGATRVLARVQGGLGSVDLPVHRAFVLGGRGTLLGEPFRIWGGRAEALAHLEWRVNAPFPSLHFGPAARTPARITLAPFVAAGWAERSLPGTPWRATPGIRVTTGLAVEWLGVFRLEGGYGVQSRDARLSFDVTRDFWSIL
jgi:hypothetical protein